MYWCSGNLEGRDPEAVGQIGLVGLQQSDVGEQLVLCAVPLVGFFVQSTRRKIKNQAINY